MVVIQLIWSLLNLASNYMFVKIGLESLLRLRTELYAHLQRLSLKFHDTRRSADSRRVLEKQHRRASAAKPDALVAGRQEPAGPQAREQRLIGIEGVRL